MIIDVPKFIAAERPVWDEFSRILDRLEAEPNRRMSLPELRRFHLLYEKTSADLAKLSTFAFAPELVRYLESLVARGYGEIHESRDLGTRFSVWRWISATLPQTFRRHARAFAVAVGVTILGTIVGATAVRVDPTAREVLLPFEYPNETPAERVKREETAKHDRLGGQHTTFSAFLMTHNIRVSLLTFGLGMTAGIGTAVLLFYNGVILGAISADYIAAGQGKFLAAWLLPHGSIEIPSILIAGQAGFILGAALLGWRSRAPLRERFRTVSADLLTLACGLAVMLVWAGFVEAFLSQFHEPVLPYSLKIAFGAVELVLLSWYLARAGRGNPDALDTR